MAEAIDLSTTFPVVPGSVHEASPSIGYSLGCLCRATVFAASVKPVIESILGEDEELNSALEAFVTEWLRMAKPSYIRDAAYYASLKSTGLPGLVESLGEDRLAEILEQLVLARYDCDIDVVRDIALILLDVQGYSGEAEAFISGIIESGACEDIRSMAVLMVAVPPAKH